MSAPFQPRVTGASRETLLRMIREDYTAGMVVAEIASKYGISYTPAYRLIKESGCAISRSRRRPRTLSPLQATAR